VMQLTRVDAKTTVLWGRPQNETCAAGFPVHARSVVCGTSIAAKGDDLEEFC